VFLKYSTYDILYAKYTYASNSLGLKQPCRLVQQAHPLLSLSINPSTNDLYAFWAGYPTANHIYYRKYINRHMGNSS